MFRILVRDPFSGVTPAVYANLSDVLIVLAYLGRRDHPGGRIVLECEEDDFASDEIAERVAERERQFERAGRDMKRHGELQIPGEVVGSRTYQRSPTYVRMFWTTWLGRGLTGEQVLERWRTVSGGRPTERREEGRPVARRPRGARRR